MPPVPLNEARSVTVRVIGPDGKRVRDGFVSFVTDDSITSIDIEGGTRVFTIARGSRSFTIDVTRATDAAGRRTGPGAFGPFLAGTGAVALRVSAPLAIEGRVVDARGKPAPDITITATPFPDDPGWSSEIHTVTARTNAGGRFRFAGLGDWTYRLHVARPYAHARVPEVDVPSGSRDVVFRLPVDETVRICVHNDRGEPAWALVSAQPESPHAGGADGRTDNNGEIRLVGLTSEASYRLEVRSLNNRELGRHEQGGWKPRNTLIRLTRTGTVRGVVHGPSGEPLRGATVWGREPDGEWCQLGRSARDGTFVLIGRKAGSLALRATPPGASWSEEGVEEVTVRGGARGVVLRMDPGLSLIVRIRKLPESDCTQAELASETQPGIRRWNVSSDPSILCFHGLEPGDRWTLRIAGAGNLALRKTGVRSDAETIEVKLESGKSIGGRIVLPTGAARVRVWAESSTLSVLGTVDAEGRFQIPGLPEGTWRVRGDALALREQWSAEVEATAGEEVVLRLSRVTR